MGQRFKPYDRDQQFLLPPSLRDWLPEGDLAYFVCELVEELDLGEFYRHYEVSDATGSRRKAASGQPAYHPKLMVALLLYAYCNGTPSSRRIARLCERDAGYRVVFDPSASLTHTGGESSRRAGAAIEAEYVRSLLRYIRRRSGRWGRLFPAVFLPTWLVRRFEILARDAIGGGLAALTGRSDEASKRWRGATRGFELVTRRLFEVISGAFGS